MNMRKEPFGRVAVRKGFVTEKEVDEALHFQRQLAQRGEKHKLIGIIMLEMGMLGTTELIDILKEMEVAAAPAASPAGKKA
ncbi:MAG: hypothetical protein A2Z34_10280 [Planctomycetes bacterium RBG_16_59_8]|nr:MAG: hypothetical protein A2Z34_10280 [Planctomycetes bacterium RBG_16_59_8]